MTVVFPKNLTIALCTLPFKRYDLCPITDLTYVLEVATPFEATIDHHHQVYGLKQTPDRPHEMIDLFLRVKDSS